MLTKLINKIEVTINNENEPVDQFEALLEQLKEKERNLNSLNELIEDTLSVDTITEDMEASEEIKEKIIFWKTKLSSKIKRINSDSIQVDTVSRNIQVIDSNSSECHELEECHLLTANQKREILKKKGCCYLCLMPRHRANECLKKDLCPICNGLHHLSICFRNRYDDDFSPNGNTDNIVSAVFKTEVNSVLLQTCAALIDDKQDEQEVVRLFLDNGSQRSFVLKSTSEKFNFPILRKENLSLCTFGAKESETKTLHIVKIKLKNRDDPNLCIEIEAVETEHISITHLPTPDENIDKKFRYLKNVQLVNSYEFNDKEISILIGADYYYQIVTGGITRLYKNLVAVDIIWVVFRRTDSEKLLTMSVIVNESNISKQLSEFWDLENLGIEAELSDDENIDNDIMSEFEAGISYQNKRYKVKFPWKPNMKTLLENNEEIVRKRFLKLRSRFKNDSSLFEDYKLVINNYLSENIIERVPVEEENLNHNTFYLPHRAVIRTDKTTSKMRIVFDTSSHAKGQLSLNDCAHTGLNFTSNLFSLLNKFRMNPIAFVSDIKMAFLMIEIDESERNFTRFFSDEKIQELI
ncbi:uncharacterized protein TNCT_469291 [Trichonephila clavata]|uniref:Peptidase aspartic putative domain-containing protein n=1 Tax=Trichonephila clavata TaxID=2740835 RepID=A0A8X6GUY6_TRICU|nr:uncharacterized protein TNCT_469291 [Trichonephila clavata]